MGLCFGRCLVGRNNDSRTTHKDDQYKTLVDDSSNPSENENFIYRIFKTKEKHPHSKFIERFWADKDMRYSRLNKSNQTSADIPLQCLDAQLLLVAAAQDGNGEQYKNDTLSGVNPSPASSSLDLEWEHEYENRNNQTWLILPEEVTIDEMSSEDDCSSEQSKNTSNLNSISVQSKLLKKKCRTSSRTSWSHISTPDSLEWDVNGDEQRFKSEDDLLDNETMELLQEIEWLKNRALNETGENIRDTLEESES